MKQVGAFFIVCIGNEFLFPLLDTVHFGTESEHQVLNGSVIFNSFTRIFVLFGTTFQYSRKRRQGEEGNNLVRLTFNSWRSLSVPQCSPAYREN